MRVFLAMLLLSISCKLPNNTKTACRADDDCLSGKQCVAGQCVGAVTGNGGGSAGMGGGTEQGGGGGNPQGGGDQTAEPPSGLKYSHNPALYIGGVTIQANLPSSQGGPVEKYSVVPDLPTGLSLDANTGIISGTPLQAIAFTNYVITAANSGGKTTESVGIRITAPAAPRIDMHPVGITKRAGEGYLMTVTVSGTRLSYQWRRNNQNIEGATQSFYAFTKLTHEHAGNYSVLVSDPFNQFAISADAVVNVTSVFQLGPLTWAPRQAHSATLLTDGNVLISGGSTLVNAGYLFSAELYDPSKNQFLPVGPMTKTRGGHSATLLQNGKVLIAGGINETGVMKAADLFDPVTSQFTATGALVHARTEHCATRLSDGRVLIVGGQTGLEFTPPELYNPTSGTFSEVGNLPYAAALTSCVALANGKALVAGGINGGSALNQAAVFDSTTSKFSAAGPMKTARAKPNLTPLSNGSILVTGGWSTGSSDPFGTELFSAQSGTFSDGPVVKTPDLGAGIALKNGDVLLCGGARTTAQQTCEFYRAATSSFVSGDVLWIARSQHTVTTLDFGRVLVVGGRTASGGSSSQTELYDP